MADIQITRRVRYADCVIGLMTFPALRLGHMPIWTLEPPWDHNKRNKSCIPNGVYEAVLQRPTIKFKYDHIRYKNVKDRSGILIHVGNYPKDTTGCVLVGLQANWNGKAEIYKSKDAMELVMQLARQVKEKNKSDTLTISHTEAFVK